MKIMNYFSEKIEEIKQGTYVPTYEQVKMLPEFSGITRNTFRIARKRWYHQNFHMNFNQFSSRLARGQKIIESEEPREIKPTNLWVGFTLIAIGIVIIGGGIVGYYMEKANCYNPAMGCGFLTGAGGLGLFGVTFLGLIPIMGGIFFPYRKRRITKKILPLLIILLPTLAFLLSFIFISFNF